MLNACSPALVQEACLVLRRTHRKWLVFLRHPKNPDKQLSVVDFLTCVLQGLAAATEVELKAGQILYLPAGWLHEVTSFSDDSLQTHLALNYWFQPPDNLDPSPAGFAEPYRSVTLYS